MIEILDMEDLAAATPLDITPELAVSAYNVLRQFCGAQKQCGACILNESCGYHFSRCPVEWPDVGTGNNDTAQAGGGKP